MCRNFSVRWALGLCQALWPLVLISHLTLQKVGSKDHNQLRERLSTGQHWAQWLLCIEKKGKCYVHSLSLFSKTLPLCSLAVMLENVAVNVTISTHITLHLYTFANLLLCVLDGRVQYNYR